MRNDIDAVLARTGGAADRALFRRVGIPRSGIDNELRSGRLTRPFPRAYLRPWLADHQDAVEHAALRSVGAPAVLSHLTALWRWELLDAPPEQIHIAVPAHRCPNPRSGVRLHRVRRLPEWRPLRGLATTRPAGAIATSWALLAVPAATWSGAVRGNDRATRRRLRERARDLGLP